MDLFWDEGLIWVGWIGFSVHDYGVAVRAQTFFLMGYGVEGWSV